MSFKQKKIIVIDNSDLSYTGDDINGKIVRGTETSLILLSEQFVRMGISVDYCNSTRLSKEVNGVNYFNKNNITKKKLYDLAIVISDANEFKRVNSLKKAVFSNSNQPLEKFIRKKQLIPFIESMFPNKEHLSIEDLSPVYVQSIGSDQAALLSIY